MKQVKGLASVKPANPKPPATLIFRRFPTTYAVGYVLPPRLKVEIATLNETPRRFIIASSRAVS